MIYRNMIMNKLNIIKYSNAIFYFLKYKIQDFDKLFFEKETESRPSKTFPWARCEAIYIIILWYNTFCLLMILPLSM